MNYLRNFQMARSYNMVKFLKIAICTLIIICNSSCLGCEDVINNSKKEKNSGLYLIHDSLTLKDLTGKYVANPDSIYYAYIKQPFKKDTLQLLITDDSLSSGFGGFIVAVYYCNENVSNKWMYKYSLEYGGINSFDLNSNSDSLQIFENLYKDTLGTIHIIRSYYDKKSDSKIDILDYIKTE